MKSAATMLLGTLLLFVTAADAQDNYEIQVYASETVPQGRTMVELHSNYTIQGERRYASNAAAMAASATVAHVPSSAHSGR